MEHSIHVYERLRALYEAELTRGLEGRISMTALDEEAVAVCGLLHDVCKVDVYRQEPKNQKTYDTNPRSRPDRGSRRISSMT